MLFGKNTKIVMVPATEVQLTEVKYDLGEFKAPRLTGFLLKLFAALIKSPLIGSLIIAHLKKQNKMDEMLRNTVIPEPPMFKPEFPPQEQEAGVIELDEDGKPEDRVDTACRCLPNHDPASNWNSDAATFRYWKIRDYAYAYRSGLTTPSMVAEHVISAVEECRNMAPQIPLLISFDPDEVRKQAAASTQRFEEVDGQNFVNDSWKTIGEFQKLALDSRINLALCESFTGSDYVASQRLRRRLMYYHMEIFKKVDIIVTPSTGMTAPVIHPSALACGESDLEVTGNLMRFAVNANILGFPAISVPVGYDKQGLPIGLQLIGRPWCEATILRLAAVIEQQWSEPKKKPVIYFDVTKGK